MGKSPLAFPFIIYKQGANTMIAKEKSNMRPRTDRRRRSGAQTSGTDVKRSRTGRRSVRVPRRIPRKGGVRASITPNICVLCYPLSPCYFQAFPTSYSFLIPCVRVEKHEHFFVSPFFTHFPESKKTIWVL